MYSDNLVIKLNGIAHHYKDVINRALVDILSQPRYNNTGAGLASLHVEVIEGDRNKSPQIIITMADHLLLLDKRKMQWTKLPKISELLKWAETKKSTPKEAVKLAWAVAWDKRKNDTWKAKPWRKKSLGPALKEMNKMIVEGFEKVIEEDLQQAIDRAA